MLERVVTHSKMLDLIQLVNDDVIDSIFRSVKLCGESPVSEDLDQSANGYGGRVDLDQSANGYDVGLSYF